MTVKITEFWLVCIEGEECWVESRWHNKETAENEAASLRRKIPGREIIVEEVEPEVKLRREVNRIPSCGHESLPY